MKDQAFFDDVCRDWQNGIALLGAGGFGLSLFLIHIYVAPLKRFLQLLWAVGVLGGISIMATQVRISRYIKSLHFFSNAALSPPGSR